MKPSDLFWLVGLLEGEGHFGVQQYSVTSRGRRYKYRRPVIQLGMNDRDVVARASVIMQCAAPRAYPSAPGHYKIMVAGKRAVELMRVLFPHMGQRRSAIIADLLSTYGAAK